MFHNFLLAFQKISCLLLPLYQLFWSFCWHQIQIGHLTLKEQFICVSPCLMLFVMLPVIWYTVFFSPEKTDPCEEMLPVFFKTTAQNCYEILLEEIFNFFMYYFPFDLSLAPKHIYFKNLVLSLRMGFWFIFPFLARQFWSWSPLSSCI